MIKYLLMLLLISCNTFNKSDFKVGDCLEWKYATDFYMDIFYDKVIAIGPNDYKFAGYRNTSSKNFVNKVYIKADSKFCKGMK